jgi:TolB-like protein
MNCFIRPAMLVLSVLMLYGCSSLDRQVIVRDKDKLQQDVRIAVLPFTDAPGQPGSGVSVSDALTNEMLRIAHWRLVERAQVQAVLKQQEFNQLGLTASDYASIGKMTRADYLVMGSVVEYTYERKFIVVPRTRLRYTIRIIDIKTGDIAASGSLNLETGKNAWIGCCCLGYYYIPILIFMDENINSDVDRSVKVVVSDLEKQLRSRKR